MKNKTIFLAVFSFILASSLIVAQQDNSIGLADTAVIASDNKAMGAQKISLDVKGMDVIDVLKMLSARSGMNIVVGKNVTGRVTLFLKDVDVHDAFELLLSANDLAYDKKGDIINVMTQRDYELIYGASFQDRKQAKTVMLKFAKAADLSRALSQIKSNIGRIVVDEASNAVVLIDTPQKNQEMEDFIKKTDLPLEIRVFNLNYALADKLQGKIQDAVTKGLGSVRIDERTNKIAITDYPQKLAELAKIISAFDEKTQQVLIDAQIIEIRPSDKFEMGVDWGYWLEQHFKIASALPLGPDSARLILGTPSKSLTKKGDYKAVIDILRTIGDTKILSSPRIMVLNNQEAKILIGTKEAYITSAVSQTNVTAVTSQSVNFVDTGIKLYVTPTINNDGFVTMKIRPEISSAEPKSITSDDKKTDIPIVTTSETETTVMIKDGVTIIIGGLKKDQRKKEVKKIPVLGDIPLMGHLFRSTQDEYDKTELVILLTPHIVSGEKSFTDFSDMMPKEGAVARMRQDDIVMDKISNLPERKFNQTKYKMNVVFDYNNSVVEKINALILANKPQGEKGTVEVSFILSADGSLQGEPEIVSSTNPKLNWTVVRCVKSSAPFGRFPEILNKPQEAFNIPIEYN